MRSVLHIVSLLMIATLIAGVLSYAQTAAANEKRFEGLLHTGYETIDKGRVPLFVDVSTPEFPSADPNKLSVDDFVKIYRLGRFRAETGL